jgi:hypothetical protein
MYIIVMILVVVIILIAHNLSIKEGLIAELKNPSQGIPNVPHDTVCMVVGLAGGDINIMGYLNELCSFDESNDLKPDTSNYCPA